MKSKEKYCIFCNPPDNMQRVIFHSDERFYILLDEFPVSPGHRLIVPKYHVQKMEDLSKENFNEIQNLIQTAKSKITQEEVESRYQNLLDNPVDERSSELVEKALDSGFLEEKPAGYNIGINEGETAGQTISHLHIHIIPKYDGDIENPEGGVRNIFPEKGSYRS